MANRVDIKMDIPSDAELKRMFDAVPLLHRHQVFDKTLRAGSRPVVTRAKQLAPRSSATGTTDKWSAKMLVDGGTGGTPRSKGETPLWKTIAQVVRKYTTAGVAVVGPKWPEGNKAYFNTGPNGRRQFFWGTDTGLVVAQIRNWIVQAFDETKAAQLSAMKKKLQQLMREIWERG